MLAVRLNYSLGGRQVDDFSLTDFSPGWLHRGDDWLNNRVFDLRCRREPDAGISSAAPRTQAEREQDIMSTVRPFAKLAAQSETQTTKFIAAVRAHAAELTGVKTPNPRKRGAAGADEGILPVEELHRRAAGRPQTKRKPNAGAARKQKASREGSGRGGGRGGGGRGGRGAAAQAADN